MSQQGFNLLEALFSGAKTIVQGLGGALKHVVRIVLEEVDKSSFGRAATRILEGPQTDSSVRRATLLKKNESWQRS